MRIKTLHEFSGVPAGTVGEAERDDIDGKIEWKITWDLEKDGLGFKRTQPLVDWFDQGEFDQYLEKT